MPISVLKADGVQGGAAINRVRREISILWLPTGLYGNQFLLDHTFGNMILPCLKSSIPAGPS